MEVDSNLEAEQAALELAQAQEWFCATNEAWEKRRRSGRDRRRRGR